MDAHEHEPSYYEVALTNRQVVSGFVILLACLFGAFLAGVWLGKEGAAPTAGPAVAAQRAPEAGEKRLEQLSFFGERPPGEAAPATAPGAAPAAAPAAAVRAPERTAPTPAEIEAEKLRKTLEAEMAAHRTEVDAAPAAPGDSPAPVAAVEPAAPAGTRVRREARAAAPPATAPAAAAPVVAPPSSAAVAAVWIQVYSSTNGPKAEELAGQLRRGAFKVAVHQATGAGGTTYRVRVGPFATRELAAQAAERLRRDYRLDTWITDQI